MNKEKQINHGFTLVELIVVITILAILGTIAILAFSGYSKNARDSARISDISNMKKSLELWILQSGTYPEPTTGTGVTYSGGIVWTQGTFGESVMNTVGRLEKKPVDPLYNVEYTYSVTSSKKEYQLGSVLEKDIVLNSIPGIEETYAATSEGTAYVSGTYNGILTTIGVNPTYILALPSIILSDISNVNLQGTINLVYEGKSNIPSSYNETSLTMTGTNFTFSPSIVWSGSSLANLNNQLEFQKLVINLQTAYKSDSNFSTLPEYASIVGTENLSSVVMSFTKGLVEINTAQELTNVSTTPANSCASNPGYIHATYTQGTPAEYNQTWQNTNSSNPCFYQCESGLYTGNDCHLAAFFTGSGTSSEPWKKIDGTSLLSCQNYNNLATSSNDGFVRSTGLCGDGTKQCLSDGVYFIAPDGNEANKYSVYCDMNTDGGGWTLNMKFKSSTSDFGFDSTYWTTSSLLNTTDFILANDIDAKYKSYHDVVGNTLKFCMNNSGLKCVNKSYTGTLASFAALSVSTQIGYTYGNTTPGDNITNWVNGLGFATVDGSINCNGNVGYSHLRIGVVRNNELDCGSSDYAWGFGGKNTYSGRQLGAGYITSWPIYDIHRSGYIYIK